MNNTFDRIAGFILEQQVSDIPESTRYHASLMLLDTLGITIAAGAMKAGCIARDTAFLLYGTGDPAYQAQLLFDGRPVSLAGAVYAAATQTDNLDGHDGYNPSKGHIGVAVVPALAILAQGQQDLSGPEALTALTIAYEIAGRAGISLHATVSDYHTSGAWNALGVVALAARLRGMDATQLREALGIAEYHGPRSQMMREIATPTMLHDGSGWGAMVGVSSAILAEQGFKGAPAITLEADEVTPYWEDLGQYWQMEHQYVKPYPVCRWAHAAIDGLRALKIKHAFKQEEIVAIHVNTFTEGASLFRAMPDTTSKAQYSLPFALATMAIYGRIGVEHISGTGLQDARVEAFLDRISVAATNMHNQRFPQYRCADVMVTLIDGRVLESGDTHARGGPEAPLSEKELVAKFMEFAAPCLGENRAGAIRDAVLALTHSDSRFSDLSNLVYAAP